MLKKTISKLLKTQKINKIKNFPTLILLIMSYLFVSFAQQSQPLSSVNNLLTQSVTVFLNLIEVLNILALVVYIGLLITFLAKRYKGDAEGSKQFKEMLVWGVIAMFFLVSVWGLVYFIAGSLGIGIGGCIARPSAIPGQSIKDDCKSTSPSQSSPSQSSENESKKAYCILNGGNWIVVSPNSGYCEDARQSLNNTPLNHTNKNDTSLLLSQSNSIVPARSFDSRYGNELSDYKVI